jgi:hypothetical protein
MIEYKTLVFEDSESGRAYMGNELDLYAKAGWQVKSKETTQQGWDFGKTCCLGIIFLPLALLGKRNNIITVILEREVSDKNKKLDEEIETQLKEEAHSESEKITKTIIVTIIGLVFFYLLLKLALYAYS